MVNISILDQSPIPEGGTAAEALRSSLELARMADGLGIFRYWCAEHHGSPSFAGTAPEIMMGAVLAATQNLRVGSGGVLLPRYSARKVAEVYDVLTALHPGRVDLGIGRAGGPAGDFDSKMLELLGLLGTDPSEIWLLGASTGSASLAARLGTAYCFAHFLNPGPGVASMTKYHRLRQVDSPSALAVRVLVADTAAKAEELALSFILWRSRKDLGADEPIPSARSTRTHEWNGAELIRGRANRHGLLFGTPEQLERPLAELCSAHEVDELVVNTLTHDPADRARSYQLLVEVMSQTSVAS
jgi:alkanesulfonate monooxygenase SsuD/methylene tetrahydromethanopterin reductase-like flavin-dependent oxidoreductase (luciferase family)